MEPSAACLALIKKYESCDLNAYWDVNGYSIGWGHHENVTKDMTITQEWADRLFLEDVGKVATAVRFLVEPMKLTDGQFGALVSFAYNEGAGALEHSTLLELLRAGNLAGAAGEFLKWVYEREGEGEVQSAQLLLRRQAERRMFLGT
jgi:lysozyme